MPMQRMSEHQGPAPGAGHAGVFTWDIPANEVRWLFALHPSTDAPQTFEAVLARVHPADRDAFERQVRLATGRPGQAYRNDYRILAPDGSVRWMSDTGWVEFDADGTPLRLIALAAEVTDPAHVEAALRRSEARWNAAIEHFGEGAIIATDDEQVVYWNPAARELHGFTRDDEGIGPLSDTPITFQLWTPDGSRLLELDEWPMRRIKRGEPVRHLELRLRRPDQGWERIVAYSGAMVDTASGERLIFLSVYDLTEQRRAEATARERERHFRQMADSMPQLVWTADPDGTVDYYNERRGEFAGFSRTRDGRWLWAPVLHPDDVEPTVKAWNDARAAGEVYQIEHRVRRADGSFRWYLSRAVPARDDAGHIVKWYGTATDIDDAKQAEGALRASEERFRLLVEQTPDGIFVADVTGRYIDVNPAGAQMLGYTREEVLHLTFADVLVAEELPRLASQIEELRRGTITRNEWRFRRKDGTEFHGEIVGRQLPDGRFQGIVRDTTERRLAEQVLRTANREKDEFLAMLAHELRNPLAPIRSGLEIMKLAGSDVQAVEKARAIAERQVVHMTRLVDDLMDVSRIARGRIVLHKTVVPLADAVRDAVERAAPLIEARGQALVVDVPGEPIAVDADLTRLSQVFANLLDNAAKYTARGGRIRLSVERHGHEAVVRVEDEGTGIPDHMLVTVFDMFTRVDSSIDTSQGGLGIGLHVVKRLVEEHGGTVTARSGGPGLGSTFTVRIPVVEPSPGVDPAREIQQAPTTAARRILVVDDHPDVAETLVMMLRIMGHDTATAHDGLDAVAVAEAFRPDVILMDIGMPNLNGYDACRRIREQPWGRRIVMVAQTGWGQRDDKQRAIASGFDRHITKPIDPAALERMLAEI